MYPYLNVWARGSTNYKHMVVISSYICMKSLLKLEAFSSFLISRRECTCTSIYVISSIYFFFLFHLLRSMCHISLLLISTNCYSRQALHLILFPASLLFYSILFPFFLPFCVSFIISNVYQFLVNVHFAFYVL